METTAAKQSVNNEVKNYLDDLKDMAREACSWSSMDPDRAASVKLNSYERSLHDDLQNIPESEQQEYISNFRSHVRDIFARESRVASPFVTGRAKFNYRRNERACASYDNAVKALSDWRERAQRAIAKRVEASKSQDERDNDEWIDLQKDILHDLKVIRGIDEDGDWWDRRSFTNSILGKVSRKANAGKVGIVQRAYDLIAEYDSKHKKPVFTKRNKFYKLLEVAQAQTADNEQKAQEGSAEVEFDGFTVVKNYDENRLQILFDDKPEADVRASLKSNGFRWSPFNSAWQRILTDNAIRSLRYLDLDIDIDKVLAA